MIKKKRKTQSDFFRGAYHGIPIGLGYLSVSFGFGITAVGSGLSVFEAFMISLTNLTSAGQAQGVSVIAAGGTLFEMALVQFIINIRYALMSLSLSQKLDKRFTLIHRLIASYGITDEIFAVCSAKEKILKPMYMYGIIAVSTFGWVTGTFLGAAAGEILPGSVVAALGILLYGMFLAIIVPPARKESGILFAVLFAALLSIICRIFLTNISGGFTMILCSVAAAVVTAVIFPKKEDTEE